MHRSRRTITFLSNPDQIEHLGNGNMAVVLLNSYLADRVLSVRPDLSSSIFDIRELPADAKTRKESSWEALRLFKDYVSLQYDDRVIFSVPLFDRDISMLELDSVRYLSNHSEVLPNILYRLSTIGSVIDRFSPDAVLQLPPPDDWSGAIELVCKGRSIRTYTNAPVRYMLGKLKTRLFSHEISLMGKKITVFVPYCTLSLARLFQYYMIVRANRGHARSREKPGKKYPILMYVINHKYLDIVVPLAKSIKADGLRDVLVLVPRTFDGAGALRKSGIEYAFLDSFIDAGIFYRALRAYLKLILGYALRPDRYGGLFTCGGYHIGGLLRNHTDCTVYLSLASIIDILLMRKIAAGFGTSLMFMPHFSENAVKSLSLGCRLEAVKVIELHRGTAGGNRVEYGLFDGDELLVAGEHAKKVFHDCGIDTGKIAITGLPIFDSCIGLLADKARIVSKVRDVLGISTNDRIVLYLTETWSGRFYERERQVEIRTIYETIKKMDGVFFIIKPHPSEAGIEVYENIAREAGLANYRVIRGELALDELVVASDVAITKFSTSGFNALLAGSRLIVVNFHEKSFDDNYFVEGDVALAVTDGDGLYDAINRCLRRNGPADERRITGFLENHFYGFHQNSIDRIKERIYKNIT